MKKIILFSLILLVACNDDIGEPAKISYYNCLQTEGVHDKPVGLRWCEGGIVLDTENYLDVFEGGIGDKGQQLYRLEENDPPNVSPITYTGLFTIYSNGSLFRTIAENPLNEEKARVFQGEARSGVNYFRWGADLYNVRGYPDYDFWITNEGMIYY